MHMKLKFQVVMIRAIWIILMISLLFCLISLKKYHDDVIEKKIDAIDYIANVLRHQMDLIIRVTPTLLKCLFQLLATHVAC